MSNLRHLGGQATVIMQKKQNDLRGVEYVKSITPENLFFKDKKLKSQITYTTALLHQASSDEGQQLTFT